MMEQAIDIASWVLLISGSLIMIISAIGIIRLPDLLEENFPDKLTTGLISG